MRDRRRRQEAILRLVGDRPICTQEELAAALRSEGFDAVQTTVSRDIHELGLVKVRGANGRLVYALPGTVLDRDRLREFAAAMRRWALSVESSGNIVLVTTPPAHASALAQAIDQVAHPHILGTVAGNDTIVVIARNGVPGAELRDELRQYPSAPSGAEAPSAGERAAARRDAA